MARWETAPLAFPPHRPVPATLSSRRSLAAGSSIPPASELPPQASSPSHASHSPLGARRRSSPANLESPHPAGRGALYGH